MDTHSGQGTEHPLILHVIAERPGSDGAQDGKGADVARAQTLIDEGAGDIERSGHQPGEDEEFETAHDQALPTARRKAWQPASTRGTMPGATSSGRKSLIQTKMLPALSGRICIDAM